MTKTQYYLYPIIVIDQPFVKSINKELKAGNLLGVYLGEYELDKSHLYIHLKKDFNYEGLKAEKRFLKSGYILKYPIPERFKSSVDRFLKGEYSKMYSFKDIEDLSIESKTEKYLVLTGDRKFVPFFKERLLKAGLITEKFNFKDWEETTELDTPPKTTDLLIEINEN